MVRLRSLFKVSAITLLISQPFLTPAAFAAGFQINEISPSLQGSATAGAAAANNDVTSMAINPATLTTLIQNQGYLGGSEIFPHIKMTDATAIHTVNVPGSNPPSNITAPVLGETSQNNISTAAFVPDGYFGWRFNDRIVAGLAVIAPYGLTTKYNEASTLRYDALYSSVSSIDIIPSVAFAINKQWSIGLGFQAQYLNANFSNFNGPYTSIPAVDAFIAATNPTYLKSNGWGYGYTLGALFKPDSFTRIGLGYRSQIATYTSGNGQQFTSPGGITPAPSPAFLFNAQTSVHASIKTPAILTLSAARDIRDWTLKATAQMNFWSCFNQLSIYMPNAFATNSTLQTKWQNSWFGAIGADYRANSKWTVKGGLAYDETPTRDGYRDPRIPDSDRIWANIGATLQVNNHFSVDGAYSHLFVKDQSVNVTQAAGSNATSTLPLEVNKVSANYQGSVDILALGLRYSF